MATNLNLNLKISIFFQDSDLLCALLLEQAAHCFLHTNPPMIRKYAFNMILAGHRYSKSAQVHKEMGATIWGYYRELFALTTV